MFKFWKWTKFWFPLFAVVIPILAIYFSLDSYAEIARLTLIERLQSMGHKKIDGVASNIDWSQLSFWVLMIFLAYKFIYKGWITNYKERLSAKEKRGSVVLLVLDIIKTIIIWYSLYQLAGWLNINTKSYWESTNVIVVSVVISEILRIINVYKEKVSKYRRSSYEK